MEKVEIPKSLEKSIPKKHKPHTFPKIQCSHCLSYSPNWDTPSTICFSEKLLLLAYAANNSVFIVNPISQQFIDQLSENPKVRIKSLCFCQNLLFIVSNQWKYIKIYEICQNKENIQISENPLKILELKEFPDSIFRINENFIICSTQGNSIYGIKILENKEKQSFDTEILYENTIGLIVKLVRNLTENLIIMSSFNEIWIFDYQKSIKISQINTPENNLSQIQCISKFFISEFLYICATDKNYNLHIWKLTLEKFSIANYLKINLINENAYPAKPTSGINNEFCTCEIIENKDFIDILYGIDYGLIKKLHFVKNTDFTAELLESEKKKNILFVDSPHKSSIFWLHKINLADKNILFSASFEGNICYWNLETESKEWNLSCLRSLVYEIAKIGQGKLLLGAQNNIKIWNILTTNKYSIIDEHKDLYGQITKIFPMLEPEESLVGLILNCEKNEICILIYHIYEEISLLKIRLKNTQAIYANWHLSDKIIEKISDESKKITKIDEIKNEIIQKYSESFPTFCIITSTSKILFYSIFSAKPIYSIQLQINLNGLQKIKDYDATSCIIFEILLDKNNKILLAIIGYSNGFIVFYIIIGQIWLQILILQDYQTKIDYIVTNIVKNKIVSKDSLFLQDQQICILTENNENPVIYIFSLFKILLQICLCFSGNIDDFITKLKAQKWKDLLNIIDILKGHEKTITSIKYIENTQYKLITGSQDKTIQIWDCNPEFKGSRAIFNIKGHSGYIISVYGFNMEFNKELPEKIICISSSEDQTVKIWNISELQNNELITKKPPKQRSKKTIEKTQFHTLFPRIQQITLTQQTNEDCEKTIALLKNAENLKIDYINIGQNIDYFLYNAHMRNSEEKQKIAENLIKFELEQCKFFEKYEYLHRFIILSLWVLIKYRNFDNTQNILQVIYENYHKIKDKNENTDFQSFFFISFIMNIKNVKEISEFIRKNNVEKKCDIHIKILIGLANFKPLEDLIDEYLENNLLLDAYLLGLLYEEKENKLCKKVLEIMKEKLSGNRQKQAQKIETVLNFNIK